MLPIGRMQSGGPSLAEGASTEVEQETQAAPLRYIGISLSLASSTRHSPHPGIYVCKDARVGKSAGLLIACPLSTASISVLTGLMSQTVGVALFRLGQLRIDWPKGRN